MNTGAFLRRVKFVHLKSRKRCCLVRREIDGLPRCAHMRPVSRSDVVVRIGVEPSGRCEKSIDGANVDALRLPAKDEGLIVRVRKASATTDMSIRIGLQ